MPRPFIDSQADFFDKLADAAAQPLAFRTREVVQPTPTIGRAWSVYCNECEKAMDDVHFHCSICDGGDYDLCVECVGQSKHCPGEGHWLIKRFIKDGEVVPSDTERVSPRKSNTLPALVSLEKDMPGAFGILEETKTVSEDPRVATRTCNSCVIVLPEHEFVTCSTCDDYDLCFKCLSASNHGHHPAHGFEPATSETMLPVACKAKLVPGRNVRHGAVCDGCDKPICGVRHKCLVCPDWGKSSKVLFMALLNLQSALDYCNDCVKSAPHTHPRHRFAALYEPIGDQHVVAMARHFGIYCDGPLCSSKRDQKYIHGVRYKCTICSDTDFCGSCEALPGNHHNRTHPLIKFKTPVRNVNVMTENEDVRGNVKVLGDRKPPASDQECSGLPTNLGQDRIPGQSLQNKSTATETTPYPQTNAATQVQTVAEIMPTEVKKETAPIPIPVNKTVEKSASPETSTLTAHFVRDSIPDGMQLLPETRFVQTWFLSNPGPQVWPAGCSVRYVGGDNMLNVDNNHPASVAAIADATESNVVGREVQVGEIVAFKVLLKAPVREGKSISYWRLKSADGTPFGHRLWCDIEVRKEEQPSNVTAIATGSPPRYQFQQAQMQAMQTMRANVQAHQAQLHAQQRQMQAQQATTQAQHVAMQHAQQAQRARLQQMAIARSEQVAQQQKAIAAYRQARELPSNPQTLANESSTMPSTSHPFGAQHSSEQSPPSDSMNLSARLAAMREQQKQRREQMMAQLSAQRDAVQSHGISAHLVQDPSASRGSHDAFALEEKRREALKQRVAHIKANILKTREEREKLTNELAQRTTPSQVEDVVADKKASNNDKVQKIVDEVIKNAEETEAEVNLSDSQMVFPKLDRESPASSLYGSATSGSSKAKAAFVENEDGEVERVAVPASVSEPAPSVSSTAGEDEDFVDLDDELEVLSASGDESDAGFLTDEEYDILDASDSETVASGWRG